MIAHHTKNDFLIYAVNHLKLVPKNQKWHRLYIELLYRIGVDNV